MTTPFSLPTICVAVDGLDRPSETFVHRHIVRLAGGNTVVTARRGNGAEQFGKPFLRWRRFGQVRRLLGRHDRRPLAPGLPADPLVRQFIKFAREHRVGFLLAEFGTVGVQLHELAAAANIPMFCYFRGFDASSRLRDPQYRRQLGAMLANIDGIVAVTSHLFEQLAQHGLQHSTKLVIPSGVELGHFAPTAKDPSLVVSVGRMVEKKAPLTTIGAFARVARQRKALRMEMIGAGPLLPAAIEEAQRLGVADRIVFHGAKSHDAVQSLMRRASVFMQHSITASDGDTEGLPTAIQEAMAAGAAVLSTRHGGIPDVVSDGQTGLLVDEHDVDGFALGLDRLVSDPILTAGLAAAARRLAEDRLDYAKLQARLEQAIHAAIVARTKSGRRSLTKVAF